MPGGLTSVTQRKHRPTTTPARSRRIGTVVCWGDNYSGQATVPGGLASVAQVGGGFSPQLRAQDRWAVVCWGDNVSGQATVPGGLNLGVQGPAVATFSGLTLNTGGTYTLTATSPGLTGATSTSILVSSNPPSALMYSANPANYTIGQPITNNAPTSSGGPVTSYSIGAGFAATGLSFNTSTGVISGTPTAVSTTASYLVTATNADGSTTASVTVTVMPAPAIGSFTAGQTTIISGNSTTLTATYSGGTGVIDHAIGSVTSGVAVSTGALTTSTILTFTLTVTNAAGTSVTATVTVTVTAGAAAKLAFTTQPPTAVTPGAGFGATVTVQDSFGNTLTTGSATVSISSSPRRPRRNQHGVRTNNESPGRRRRVPRLRAQDEWDRCLLGQQQSGQVTLPGGLASITQVSAGTASLARARRWDGGLLGIQRLR